jgi:cobalt/nickel transport system permease protein
MHIPDSMLHGSVCPVTAGLSIVGIIVATYVCTKSERKPSAASFGAVTALVFAGQMMNFPIMNGTSGHLLGGVLASTLLGVPFGVLSLALVVTLQSLLFSDGGVLVLGANILNMAILGAGFGGLAYYRLVKNCTSSLEKFGASAAASWLSMILASSSASLLLAIDGQIALRSILPAMLGVHSLIGIGEATITIVLLAALPAMNTRPNTKQLFVVPLLAASLIAFLLSPFASAYPDGLEWVAAKYSFLHEAGPTFVGLLNEYALSTAVAGLIGVLATFVFGFIIIKLMAFLSQRAQHSMAKPLQ